jgi:hypothetical protein
VLEALIESAERGKERSRVSDVAGFVQTVGTIDRLSEAEGSEAIALTGMGPRATLDHDVVMTCRFVEQRLQPAGSRLAVIVSEDDERRLGRSPTRVASSGRTERGFVTKHSKLQPGGRELRSFYWPLGSVVDYHHLESFPLESLLLKGSKQRGEALGAVAGSHYDANSRRRHAA